MRVFAPAAAALGLMSLAAVAAAQTAVGYQKPPEPIERLLDAPVTPTASLSPDRTTLLITQAATFPTIADVAQPRYRLAGLRFNPATNGPSRDPYAIRMALQPVKGGAERPIAGLPSPLKANDEMWSPDGRHIAFVQRTAKTASAVDSAPSVTARQAAASSTGLELWVIDVASAKARRLGSVHVNGILGRRPCAWTPDAKALLCKVVPAGRGASPLASDVPKGPNVEENLGKVTAARTNEDMLKTPEDEEIFSFYSTAQLMEIPLAGAPKPLAVKGLIDSISVSPDGQYALVTETHKPFSYNLPVGSFPLRTEVINRRTGAVITIDDRPLADNLVIARGAVAVGPRGIGWRAAVPATLTWMEAGDDGDPRKKVAVHDRLMTLSAPFQAKASVMMEFPLRVGGGGRGGAVRWGNAHLAIVTMSRFTDRHTIMEAFDPSDTTRVHVLYEGSSQDRYHSPGEPVEEPNASGQPVVRLTADGQGIFFIAPGATPTGDKPFLAVMPVTGGQEKILFRSEDPYFIDPVTLISDDLALVRKESVTDAPNYFTVSLAGQPTQTPVTHFASPYAGIAMPTRQLLKYKRADGLDLSATLWLPAGYDKGKGPLPTLMEAYPAEFTSRDAAAQVSGSPNRFPRISWGSPVFFTQTGYAVLENAAIPILGENGKEPNDSYTEQLVDGARAAIEAGAATGAVDPKRMAVMGHSYGAFMTANLLAHSNLFRAGIARSGAYNRTLTPYGFQNEERTFWQAPEVYEKMSPFFYADKVKTPILLIHGEADDNQGTFPIQSERFYQALKGQGATVRLVFLPLEAHGYEAHESLQHMLWEMNRWLDTYVKPAISQAAQVAAGQ